MSSHREPVRFRSQYPRLGIRFLLILIVLLPATGAAPAQQLENPTPTPTTAYCTTVYTLHQNSSSLQVPSQYEVAPSGLRRLRQGEPYLLPQEQAWCAGVEREKKTPPEGLLFWAYLEGRRQVYFYGQNMPLHHEYFVTLRLGDHGGFTKIGLVGVKKDGTVKGSFKIPAVSGPLPAVWVCLKEVLRGYMVCRVANNH